jgi:aspartyl-tRNA(Asn)/glutamyl-tRNA(Gln) amidotransferase subunit C
MLTLTTADTLSKIVDVLNWIFLGGYMPITNAVIAQIAHMARIDISEELEETDTSLQKDLNRIVDMVEQIITLNTDGIEPMAHPLDTGQRFREDVVTEINQRDTLLSLAPNTEAGLFLVPKVIE